MSEQVFCVTCNRMYLRGLKKRPGGRAGLVRPHYTVNCSKNCSRIYTALRRQRKFPTAICVVCKKVFEKFRGSLRSRNLNHAAVRRPRNSITCSKQCSSAYLTIRGRKDYEKKKHEDKLK